MSLVGTRPPTVDEWDKYELHHRARLATKPGLTGMWQVSGRSNITDFAAFTYFHYTYMSKRVKEKENIDVFFNGKRYFLIGFVTSVLCLSVMLLYGYPLIRYIIIAVAILIGWFFKNKISMIWRIEYFLNLLISSVRVFSGREDF